MTRKNLQQYVCVFKEQQDDFLKITQVQPELPQQMGVVFAHKKQPEPVSFFSINRQAVGAVLFSCT